MSEIVEVAFQEEAEFEVDFSGTGKDGEEGGYYIPSGTDGVMRFTPSKTGMPEVPSVPLPQGPQGEQGETGQRGADGVSVTAVTRQTGDGSPGTTDEYVVELSDGRVGGTFTVYHGKDGCVPDDWEDRLADVEDRVADLMYEPIAVTAFHHNADTQEMGAVVTDITLSWATSKAPAALTLDGEGIDAALTGKTLTGLHITSDKTWTLEAADERGATATKTATLRFLNGVYYGAGVEPDGLDTSFLTKVLSGTRKRTFTATAGEGEYIWYALPVRLGACSFKVGGFEGGFNLYVTVEFTNDYGCTEPYYIYRSGQTGLGVTTVEVS